MHQSYFQFGQRCAELGHCGLGCLCLDLLGLLNEGADPIHLLAAGGVMAYTLDQRVAACICEHHGLDALAAWR